jgi:hypothetical protein
LAVKLQQVEGLQHGLADGTAPVERVEDRDAIRAAGDGLAVERERSGAQQRRGDGNCRIPGAPVVAVSSEQPHDVTLTAHLKAIAVVFDFVDPVRAGRRLVPRHSECDLLNAGLQ